MSDKCECGKPAVAIAYLPIPNIELGLINITEPHKVCIDCANKAKNDGCRVETIKE